MLTSAFNRDFDADFSCLSTTRLGTAGVRSGHVLGDLRNLEAAALRITLHGEYLRSGVVRLVVLAPRERNVHTSYGDLKLSKYI